MKPLGIEHHFSDGVYAKEMRIPAHHYVVKHVHDYNHISILAEGSVVVEVGNTVSMYSAPCCVQIPKGTKHTIRALSDAVWYCIHATDEKDPERVDQVLIKETA